MTFKNFFLYQKILGVISLLVIAVIVNAIHSTFIDLGAVQDKRLKSIQLADELRQSSDDLTRLARLFATTGDSKYEKMYEDVIKIRNGEIARPENYEGIYWDLVLEYGQKPKPDGKKVVLLEEMKNVGMTQQELAFLDKAAEYSDALVKMETVAMNAAKGLFEDSNGKFTIKSEPDLNFATKLVHSNEYMKEKAKIVKPIDDFLSTLSKRVDGEVQEIENKMFTYIIILIVLLVLTTVLFVILFVINRNKIPNLYLFSDELAEFFKYLNHEAEYSGLINIDTNDEIGRMTKLVNQNIEKTKTLMEQDDSVINDVKRVVNDVKAGYLDRKIEKSTSNASLEELKINFNEMLSLIKENVCVDINKLTSLLDNFNKLDFRGRITNDDGKVAVGINNLAEVINEILRENKSNGLTLDESSNILLENVDKLNISSNSAAASLEETAAALEQITSNIRNNTESIAKMAKYSNEITKASSDGEKLANQTTVAMDEINTQVNLVNEAISVIDQIAFQTNILSLNAAVEAATAGEAGKGFAVVAQEVRNLANRSAEAAREIKEIVEQATLKANEGKEIASNMIDGYKGLNDSISQTINLISDIEMSSKEQLSGIEQINDAVNSLDRQTQQNAAIASQAHDIALVTDEIAKLVVSNANAKEFNGKNEVKPKNVNTAKYHKKDEAKSIKASENSNITQQNNKHTSNHTNQNHSAKVNSANIIKDNSSDDEWESF